MILFDGTHLASTVSVEDLDEMSVKRMGMDPMWLDGEEDHPHYDMFPGEVNHPRLKSWACPKPTMEVGRSLGDLG